MRTGFLRIAAAYAGVFAMAFVSASPVIGAEPEVLTPAVVTVPLSGPGGDLSAWQLSSTPEYYKGGFGRTGLSLVDDAERGEVLRCGFAFADAERSEPVFITRKLAEPVRRVDIQRVRFWAKLSAPLIDPDNGFILRLRTSPTQHDNWNVQQEMGRPFPVNEWVEVDIDTSIGQKVRNIWGRVFDSVIQMTFRMDDVDTENGGCELLLDDIEMVVRTPPAETDYTPKPDKRPVNAHPRVLYLRHAAAGHYPVVAALRALDPAVEITRCDYRGRHFEFFGFPASRRAVLSYDLIVMLDVDPFVLSGEQSHWLADAVASGSHLVFFGGSVTLTDSKGFPAALRGILPVDFELGSASFSSGRPAEACMDHSLTRGFDAARLGRVHRMQPLTPKPGSTVAWRSGDVPLVVTWSVGHGGVTVLNAQAYVEREATGDFFTSALSDDFLREVFRFGLGAGDTGVLEALSIPEVPVGGGRIEIGGRIGVDPDVSLLWDLDGLSQAVNFDSETGVFRIPVVLPFPTHSTETHEAVLKVVRSGRVVQWRDFGLVVRHPLDASLAWEVCRSTFAPGSPVEFTLSVSPRATFRIDVESPFEGKSASKGDRSAISPRLRGAGVAPGGGALLPRGPLSARASIVDPLTGYQWEVPCVAGDGDSFRFRGDLPNLRSGSYLVEGVITGKGNTGVGVTDSCVVVDPLVRDGFFPIMSVIGLHNDGHYLDEAGIRARVDDLVAHGFNTAAITGFTAFREREPRRKTRLLAYAESYAAQQGMATTFEYSNFGLYKRRAVLSPCVFSDGFASALHDRLEPQVDVARRTPRLLTAKVVDEPAAGPDNLDMCEACQRAFRERYGIELEAYDTTGPVYARWALADFIGDYVGEVFAGGQQFVQNSGVSFGLLLTYMATGLGYNRPLRYQQDALDWSRHVSWADFDIYPYFYPKSQRLRMVQAGFGLAYMRDVARARGIPWGFYMELDDRNWPFQQNPAEATAECGFTAVAHGADYLNSFIHRLASTGCGARPARWAKAGEALRVIRRCGPLLSAMPAVRANVAFLFPNTHEMIENGYERPDYALALCRGGFGDVDIVNEEVLMENGRVPYAALILLGARYLHSDAVALLKPWLLEGGVLVTDGLPVLTERGDAIDWGVSLREWGAEAGDVETSLRFDWEVLEAGAGRILAIPSDLAALAESTVESPVLDPAAVRALRHRFRDLLDSCAAPNVRVEYEENDNSVDTVTIGLRGNEEGAMLIVVNHQPIPQRVTVYVARPDLRRFVDMADFASVKPSDRSRDGVTFELDVPARWARVISCWRRRPRRVRLVPAAERVSRGGAFAYEVSAEAGFFRRAAVGGLIEVTVRGPDGVPVGRFGGAWAPDSGGVSVSVPLPVNALPGTYAIEARLPQAGATDTATVTVE